MSEAEVKFQHIAARAAFERHCGSHVEYVGLMAGANNMMEFEFRVRGHEARQFVAVRGRTHLEVAKVAGENACHIAELKIGRHDEMMAAAVAVTREKTSVS